MGLEKLKKQLSNGDFIQRAPKEVIENQKELMHQTEKSLEAVCDKLDALINL